MSKKSRQEGAKPAAPAARSRWADYFRANVIFFAFLFLLAWVVKASCESPDDQAQAAVGEVLRQTFTFLLLLFGGGFALVTLFDAAYEFYSAEPDEAPAGEGPAQA